MNGRFLESIVGRIGLDGHCLGFACALLALCWIAAPLDAASVDPVEVETLEGEILTGVVSDWTSDGISIETDNGLRTLDADALLTMRFGRLSDARPTSSGRDLISLEFVDGSVFRGNSYVVQEGRITLGRASGEPIETETNLAKSMLFSTLSGDVSEQWHEITKLDATGDILVVLRKGALDYLEGVVGDVTEEQVGFRFDGDDMQVPITKVKGLIYYQSQPRKLGPSLARISTTDGDRIEAQRVELVDDHLRLVSRAGVELVVSLTKVLEADFSSGKRIYLSDLEWDSVRWSPYYAVANQSEAYRTAHEPRRDKSFTGGPLQLGGVDYQKGIVLRSRTELVYRLPEGFRRFDAMVGIDDRVGSRGDVHLTLLGDDRELFAARIVGDADPLPLSIELDGAKRLKIVVDYGEDQDVADHLNLCIARISK